MAKEMYYFNTQERVDSILNGPINITTIKSVLFHLIWDLYHKGITSQNEIEAYVNNFMSKRSMDYHPSCYARTIRFDIKTVSGMRWRNIEGKVPIRKSEVEYISSFNDIKKEKLLFVYLAIAKFRDMSRDTPNHWEDEDDTKVFKMARVNIPACERDLFIYRLSNSSEKIHMNNKINNVSKRIDYISDDINDPIILQLDESNYKELAFTYLNWKNNGGYKRCKDCGRLFKIKGNRQYCFKCEKTHLSSDNDKVINCIDCGNPVVVSPFDNETIRCEECYKKYRRARNLDAVKKYQSKK